METYKLSDQQIEALQKAFDEFDVNNDGTITPKEILGILKSHDLYKTQDDISEFVTKYDMDGDQKITFEEYLTIFKKQMQWKELKDNAFDLFCEFDENGDGNITAKEAAKALAKWKDVINEERVLRIFDESDISRDGKVDFDEFYRLAKRL